jgi:hypothetical protein
MEVSYMQPPTIVIQPYRLPPMLGSPGLDAQPKAGLTLAPALG